MNNPVFLLVKYKVWQETMHSILFSETIVKIVMTFIFTSPLSLSLSLSIYIYIYIYTHTHTHTHTHIMGASFTKLRFFFHRVSHINLFLSNSRETLYGGHVQLSDEASEPFKNAVFQLVVSAKRSPCSSSFMGPKRRKSEGAKSGL